MTEGPRRDATGLPAVAIAALLLAYGWWWVGFSGPFRWLVDRELALFGDYAEWPTGGVLGVAVGLAAWLLARPLARVPAPAARVLVRGTLVAASAVVLAKAWQLGNGAAQLPSLDDPVQVVDLDRVGDAAPPTGHVQLLGVPDHGRQALTRFVGRGGGGSWDFYVPVQARHRRAPADSVRIVVTHEVYARPDAPMTVPEDPTGVLVADGVGARTRYEVRRQGLRLVDRPSVLFWPGSLVGFDDYVAAALLALPVVLAWTVAAYRWVRRRVA